MVVNQKELAQCLGISSRRVRQLREEGLFHLSKVEKGYNLDADCQPKRTPVPYSADSTRHN